MLKHVENELDGLSWCNLFKHDGTWSKKGAKNTAPNLLLGKGDSTLQRWSRVARSFARRPELLSDLWVKDLSEMRRALDYTSIETLYLSLVACVPSATPCKDCQWYSACIRSGFDSMKSSLGGRGDKAGLMLGMGGEVMYINLPIMSTDIQR